MSQIPCIACTPLLVCTALYYRVGPLHKSGYHYCMHAHSCVTGTPNRVCTGWGIYMYSTYVTWHASIYVFWFQPDYYLSKYLPYLRVPCLKPQEKKTRPACHVLPRSSCEPYHTVPSPTLHSPSLMYLYCIVWLQPDYRLYVSEAWLTKLRTNVWCETVVSYAE